MASRRRSGRATTVAAVGLCLAAVTTTHTSLAFHLHTAQPRGTVAVGGGGGCDHAAARRSATCRLAMLRRRGEARQPSGEEERDNGHGSGRREGRASKELSALLLSAMLLGNPQLSDAAAVTQATGSAAAGSPTVDPTVQSRLIADLEKRLMSIPTTADSGSADGAAAAPAAAAPAARADNPEKFVATAGAVDVDAASSATAPRIQPMFVPPTATSRTPAAAAEAPAAMATVEAAPAAPAPEAPAAPAPSPAARPPPTTTTTTGTGGSSKEPLIKMKDYSFSIKLPELNLPPVAPITVPEEGNPFADLRPGAVFRAPSGDRVAAQPDLPGAGVVREALQGVARGEGVRDLADALAAAAPKQADYNRAVMELEDRVSNIVKTVDNPTFAPGVPLAPEFVSMLSNAKDTAFNGVRPYLPKGVEPELALFMLTTLPVLTVALRTADENSRRPKPAPLPPGYRPPRAVRFPNSPAKVDADAVAEARQAREAENDIVAVRALREELSARGLAAVPADGAASVSAAAAAVVDLEGGVAAAVAAKPETMTAELARLRGELAAAGKLAAKVEALERANARLMVEVADLRKEPSLEEIKLRADREAARAAAHREREERRAAAYSDVKAKADKLSAARQVMADNFPSRETDMAALQATEIEPPAEPEPAADVDVEEVAEGEDEVGEDEPSSSGVRLLKPEDVDPLSAARERLADAFPGSDTAGSVAAPAAAAAASKVSKKKAPAAAKKKKAAAAAPKKRKAATKKSETVTMEKEPKAPKKAKVAKAGAAGRKKPAVQNGGALKEPAAAAPPEPTPDDYDDLSEDLSRALRGVQGYDLDALDLEMDAEDLEELRTLEREMGELDLASLEAEFDQEDDESISQALRMAAESALAHTSGGGAGRQICTASRSAADTGGGGGSSSRGSVAVAVAEGDGGGVPMGGRGGVAATRAAAEDELDAFRRLEAEAGVDFGDGEGAWGGAGGRPGADPAAVSGRGGGGGGGAGVDDGDWSALSSKAIARKKVAALKEYLDEEGVDYPSKVKKAELVDLVVGLLAEG